MMSEVSYRRTPTKHTFVVSVKKQNSRVKEEDSDLLKYNLLSPSKDDSHKTTSLLCIVMHTV